MKAMKHILTLVLLCLTILYSGHNTLIFSSHIIHVAVYEGYSNHPQRTDTDNSSYEDDFPIVSSADAFQNINYRYDNFTLPSCFLPSKLYYSIWLPPDIC